METELASRVKSIKPSPTLALNARTKQLKAAGGDIISLSVGEPDFETPAHIKDEAIKAIQAGFTRYTAVDGTPELKESIIEKFSRDNELSFQDGQILVSTGAKQSLYNVMQALLEAGDEVIIPAPYWVSYPDMCKLAGATPTIIETSVRSDFKITAEQLDNAINEKTKLFLLNSPSNPSGMVYTKTELAALGEVLAKHPHVVIMTDDIYEHILWTHRPFTHLLNVCPDLTNRTVVINGVSKAYAMTGWRIGYAAGPEAIIAAARKIQSQSTSNPCSIAQKAAVAALSGDQRCVHDMTKEFKNRHDFIVESLNEIDGVICRPSNGTFYSFPNIAQLIEKMAGTKNDMEFAENLLNKTGVAVVPGSAFGDRECIRISFAASMDTLNDAMRRIKTFVKSATS